MIPESTIQEAVRRIVDAFAPERVVLFGSYARGGADDRSDLDLLVVGKISSSENGQGLWLGMERSLAGLGIERDILILTPAEFLASPFNVGTASHYAHQEGRVLYARAA